jgi:hypothetical protein
MHLVVDVVTLRAIGHGVAVIRPSNVELHVVLLVCVRPDLHELGAPAADGLLHVLDLEVVQIVLDLNVLRQRTQHHGACKIITRGMRKTKTNTYVRTGTVSVGLPGIVVGRAGGIDDDLRVDLVVR